MFKNDLLKAIKAFEKIFKCHLSFHDYTGAMHDCLPELPYYHLNIVCSTLKDKTDSLISNCIRFDRNAVQSRLTGQPEAFIKRCHCGIVEAVVPVLADGKVAGAVFAGPYRMSPQDISLIALHSRERKPVISGLDATLSAAPRIDAATLENVMALGAALAGCMEKFIAEQSAATESGAISRKDRILEYMESSYKRNISLGDLASYLGLRESRTSQLVKRYFGKTFPDILMEKRLSFAENLLINSSFSLDTVAAYSGFNDTSYFFRAFKKRYGVTPGTLRQSRDLKA